MAYQSSVSSQNFHSQNGAASTTPANSTWRNDSNSNIEQHRNLLKQELFRMFAEKVSSEQAMKIVPILENILYSRAPSLEEYLNRSSLRARSQAAAQLMNGGTKRVNHHQQGAPANSTPSSRVSQMIPTPGTDQGVANREQTGSLNGQALSTNANRGGVGPGYARMNGHTVGQENGHVARPGMGGRMPASALNKLPLPGMTTGMPGREPSGNSGPENVGPTSAAVRPFGNGILTGGTLKGGSKQHEGQPQQMPYHPANQQGTLQRRAYSHNPSMTPANLAGKFGGSQDPGTGTRVYAERSFAPGVCQGGATEEKPRISVAGSDAEVGRNEQGGGTPNSSEPLVAGGVGRSANVLGVEDQKKLDERFLVTRKFRNLVEVMIHAKNCHVVERKGPCPPSCAAIKEVLRHQAGCTDSATCQNRLCLSLTKARCHFESCRSASCTICIPIRHGGRCGCQVCSKERQAGEEYMGRQKARQMEGRGLVERKVGEDEGPAFKRARSEVEGEGLHGVVNGSASGGGVGVNGEVKRVKGEGVEGGWSGGAQVPAADQSLCMASFEGQALPQTENHVSDSHGEVKLELPGGVVLKADAKPEADGAVVVEPRGREQEAMREGGREGDCNGKGKGKVKGVGTSLTELFTPEMIHQHVDSLRHAMSQMSVDGKGPRYQPAADRVKVGEECCTVCLVASLFFDPPPIYCTSCGKRIQRQKTYYTMGQGESKVCVCTKCFTDMRGDMMVLEGVAPISRAKLEKKQNNDEADEGWVQCTSCNGWVHQICALFNVRRNGSEADADFTCPLCCAQQMEGGERDPLPPTAVLGAKDLPTTALSDKLEARLEERLRAERVDRAAIEQRGVEEVRPPDELVVRVVSSVDKKLDTKPRFLGIFVEGEYPSEFLYKSKVVLLFQKIEGVEVCLFGMYVQEFGSECQQPNQRRVYLSYLDSVKYFRPELRTVQNEALRTFVYHEILIGYLDYCKARGFTSCYIWACPPLKGEDYILYCHPEIQKTPQPPKLREWYLAMLRKAQSEGIVVEVTNLYETFFIKCGESKVDVSATRLPYFDGDYWPGAIEEVLEAQEVEKAKNPKGAKKGAKKKLPSKRGKAGEEAGSLTSPDNALMAQLGNTILTMKEDFILVNLRPCCSYCRNFILGDRRYTCAHCPSFSLCPGCYVLEVATSSAKERHPVLLRDVVHELQEVEQQAAPTETTDADDLMESEFFDTRQNFLSLCQGNHYQYDTLRRAKHSSMMVLYHLHNPTAPGFVSTCNVCHKDIDKGVQWRCHTCDFDMCDSCRSLQPNAHPHPLSQVSSSPSTAQNAEARQQRVDQMRAMLVLLQHASHCTLTNCAFPKCHSLHRIFVHGSNCRVRAVGGCAMCKHMWKLLKFHAKTCKERVCKVPRCKDLKEHMRRLTVQDDSRRRAAVQEMARMRSQQARLGT